MEEANEYAKESFRLKDDVNEMAAKMVSSQSQSEAIIEKFKSELQAEKKSNLVALNEKDKKIRTTRTSAMKMSASMQGVILVARERNRNMETSITATHCRIQLTKDMQDRMEYAWAYARWKTQGRTRAEGVRSTYAARDGRRQTSDRAA